MLGTRIVICMLAIAASTGAVSAKSAELYEAGRAVIPAGQGVGASERIDQLVFGRLQDDLGLPLPRLCSDSVFLRRAYLTVIGTLPSEDEARVFLDSDAPDKRQRVIDELLGRPEFVDYSAMRWSDLLRVKAEFPINLWPNAVQAYYRYIHASLRENKPYHEFVRELLTSSGSNFRVGQVNFYRAMQDRSPHGIASTVALTFLGERVEHWPKKKHDALAGFFSQVSYKPTSEWKEEIVFFDPAADEAGLSEQARFPDGSAAEIEAGQDPRGVFANWLLRPENKGFSRCVSNRVWFWLMGRGLVHEPDDFHAGNPPSNPGLLEFLQDEFVGSRCDTVHLFRIILNSQVFQISPIPGRDSAESATNFGHYVPRRMGAEVLIDALNQITQTKEIYSSSIPEPFTFIPEEQRAIAMADGSITSSFLELFGRPPRDTGMAAERSLESNAAQRLHLLNSTHVLGKIDDCPLVRDAPHDDAEMRSHLETIYLTLLSRAPSAEEVALLESYSETSRLYGDDLASDVVWALLNSPEFFLIH